MSTVKLCDFTALLDVFLETNIKISWGLGSLLWNMNSCFWSKCNLHIIRSGRTTCHRPHCRDLYIFNASAFKSEMIDRLLCHKSQYTPNRSSDRSKYIYSIQTLSNGLLTPVCQCVFQLSEFCVWFFWVLYKLCCWRSIDHASLCCIYVAIMLQLCITSLMWFKTASVYQIDSCRTETAAKKQTEVKHL